MVLVVLCCGWRGVSTVTRTPLILAGDQARPRSTPEAPSTVHAVVGASGVEGGLDWAPASIKGVRVTVDTPLHPQNKTTRTTKTVQPHDQDSWSNFRFVCSLKHTFFENSQKQCFS